MEVKKGGRREEGKGGRREGWKEGEIQKQETWNYKISSTRTFKQDISD